MTFFLRQHGFVEGDYRLFEFDQARQIPAKFHFAIADVCIVHFCRQHTFFLCVHVIDFTVVRILFHINDFYLFFSQQFAGIEYLCENNLLQMDAQDVAHFLYKGEGLNKTAIGKYYALIKTDLFCFERQNRLINLELMSFLLSFYLFCSLTLNVHVKNYRRLSW